MSCSFAGSADPEPLGVTELSRPRSSGAAEESLVGDAGANGGSASLAAEVSTPGAPSGGEHAATDEKAHQENANEDHGPGHEHEDQGLPAQLNFTKGIFLSRCHQVKN